MKRGGERCGGSGESSGVDLHSRGSGDESDRVGFAFERTFERGGGEDHGYCGRPDSGGDLFRRWPPFIYAFFRSQIP